MTTNHLKTGVQPIPKRHVYETHVRQLAMSN